jgi:hypothetical protein
MPLLTPPAVVAVTDTVPVPAGATAVICVAESTVNEVAAVPPKVTAVTHVRAVPVRMTVVPLVPPVVGPEVGERKVMVGIVVPP